LLKGLFAIPLIVLIFAVCTDTSGPKPAPVSPSLDVIGTPPAVLVGAADIGICTSANDEATAKLVDGIDGIVMMLGDGAYPTGTAAEYADCYGPTWGRHLARTRPAPGDVDYATAGAPGYFGYFGAAAGTAGAGYYSYDAGEWHVVVLNSNISMKVGSVQINWLTADLQANRRLCTVAYWHHARFYSSSSGIRDAVKPAWDVLYAFGADVVVNGNPRFYERFAPQTPDGVADPQYGIREFISGLGGAASHGIGTSPANSQVRQRTDWGVLKLALGSGSYTWEFVPIAGKTFTDSGTGDCHGEPPPVARPGGPYTSEGPLDFDGSTSRDPQGDALTYAWDFGDGTEAGTGSKPSHTYATNGTYTVSLTVTDANGDISAPTTTTVTIQNAVPVVSGSTPFATFGSPTTLEFSFTDYALDAPWSYQVAWGDGTVDPGQTTESGMIRTTHTYTSAGDYTAIVSVTDVDGGTGTTELAIRVREPEGAHVLIGVGDIATCGTKPWHLNDEATANILDLYPTATVFTAGDNAYPSGTAADYANCYEPGWGRHKARTWAALGNHEYDEGNADATFDYFGERAGPRGLGYYSFDLGAWHIVVLNDNPAYVPFKAGSAQDVWLQNDLATTTKRCVMAIWHQPMMMSSNTDFTYRSSRKIFWDRLYAAGAEVVVSGHQHFYERFAPMNPDRQRDDARGIRAFIVGTGGDSAVEPTVFIAGNSEVRNGSFGVMKFTLHDGGYAWEFLPIAGSTFNDKGSGTCH
jgi:hypothetical protein